MWVFANAAFFTDLVVFVHSLWLSWWVALPVLVGGLVCHLAMACHWV